MAGCTDSCVAQTPVGEFAKIQSETGGEAACCRTAHVVSDQVRKETVLPPLGEAGISGTVRTPFAVKRPVWRGIVGSVANGKPFGADRAPPDVCESRGHA
jgi:hypothetical protein